MASMNLKEINSVDSMHIEPDASEDAILPRIGDEYQAKIPSLIERSEYLSWDPIAAPNQARYLGLHIEVTWVDLNHPIPSKNPTKKETSSSRNDNLSDEDKYLVPMSPSDVKWIEDEKASLILGLYIFRKNFVEVTRFVETKKKGEIHFFYYGEFYSSDEYNRWSDWRKKNKNSMKFVHGQRIFYGQRHQELLSRLLPTLTEDNRNALSKVSKNFSDEKMELVDYVSSLKFIVGINELVKAIGIGKGKRDLTRMAMEPSKSNSIHPKIPTGKECSSLTTSEIIKFLSGDYRLSKARSNDLFWEAVWPRLLARGWHSEQPRDQASCIYGVKVCLVFLVPGVKKFSRRKLVKGEHYYDSVTDVLSKVSKEPEIIELDSDIELINGEKKQDNDDDDTALRQKHRYLQPRTPNRMDDVMVFTVVDTSLSGGKIRALRSLPTEISISLNIKDPTQSYEETTESESTKRKSKEISVGCLKSEKNLLQGKNKKHKKSHLSQNLKRANGEHIVPVKKRFKKETGKSELGPRMENGISSCCSRPPEFPGESFACDTSGNETHALIDLNVPQVSPELENGLLVTAQETRRRSKTENVNPRRQSTRNRPPTTKALEALAYGYF